MISLPNQRFILDSIIGRVAGFPLVRLHDNEKAEDNADQGQREIFRIGGMKKTGVAGFFPDHDVAAGVATWPNGVQIRA
ncbi:MAG TPA: hypothetical protein VMU28_01270 [Terriglobales bacterium]|nr:hypothetical protein [Terriglobales bacterium]